jgi:hypothetical protein
VGSFLDKLLLGLKSVDRNGNPMPVRPVLNFVGFTAVVDNPSLGTTDIFGSSTGSSGGGGITIIENAGTPMPAEPALNFVGFSVVDDPGNTRTTVTANPTPPLSVESNGVLQTQRYILNFVGFTVADDAPNVRTNVSATADFPAPAPTYTANHTVGPTETWVLYTGHAGGFTFDLSNIVAGRRYYFTYVAGTTIGGANAITFSHGTGAFVLENPNNRGLPTAATQPFGVDSQTIVWCLDATNGVVRCLGVY